MDKRPDIESHGHPGDLAANANAHRHMAEKLDSIRCAVITVTDSRDRDEDVSGAIIRDMLEAAGHEIVHYDLLGNDGAAIDVKMQELLAMDDLQFAVFTGGTGLGPRDLTVDVVRSYFEKRVEGFGELFRLLSYEEIGPAAMLSRADAGVVSGKVFVSLPGSKNAVRMALEKLLVPELRHLVNEPNRVGSGGGK